MWSFSLVMSECSLSGRGQGHVSNFYIVDLENFATVSRRYTGDIHIARPWSVCLWHLRQWQPTRVMVECTLSITHCLRIHLQLHAIDSVRTCRISSFCTVAWQLARLGLLLTRRIAIAKLLLYLYLINTADIVELLHIKWLLEGVEYVKAQFINLDHTTVKVVHTKKVCLFYVI